MSFIKHPRPVRWAGPSGSLGGIYTPGGPPTRFQRKMAEKGQKPLGRSRGPRRPTLSAAQAWDQMESDSLLLLPPERLLGGFEASNETPTGVLRFTQLLSQELGPLSIGAW